MTRTRSGWLIAGVLAAATLVTLALVGDERGQSLQRHEASGLLRDVAPERVRAVTLAIGDRQSRWVRRGDAWLRDDAAPGGAAATSAVATRDAAASAAEPNVAGARDGARALAARVDAALLLLRNAAPERELAAEATEFGLGATALRVSLDAGEGDRYEIAFGAANPIGLARYTRVAHAGESRIVLLPAYVADAWQQLALSP